jgi:hypothetical protein
LYDCDFNQQLGLSAANWQAPASQRYLRDLLDEPLDHQGIQVANHGYGCTAGHGSRCSGALN